VRERLSAVDVAPLVHRTPLAVPLGRGGRVGCGLVRPVRGCRRCGVGSLFLGGGGAWFGARLGVRAKAGLGQDLADVNGLLGWGEVLALVRRAVEVLGFALRPEVGALVIPQFAADEATWGGLGVAVPALGPAVFVGGPAALLIRV